MRDEQLHAAVVARSTFPSQHAQSTSASERFSEAVMWKKCTPLWREARVVVKTHKKNTIFGALLEVAMLKKVHAVVARSKFRSQNVQSTSAPEHFWKLRCSKVHAVVARRTFQSPKVQNTTCSCHFWTLQRRFVWQAQGILHPARSEQKVKVL